MQTQFDAKRMRIQKLRPIFAFLLFLILFLVAISVVNGSEVEKPNIQTHSLYPSTDARDAVQYVNQNGIRVIKVNLTHSQIRIRALQANDSGGVETVQSMASRWGAIAAINGDYFSYLGDVGTEWPEGMMYVDGNDKTRCRSGFDCVHFRRSIAFSSSDRPNIGQDRGGRDLYNVVAGGPQFMFNGQYQWNHSVQGNCPSSGQVVINDEVFGCSAADWNNGKTLSAVGYSDDGNTLYMAASEGNKTMQEMHDVLWQQGARNALRLDSGGSRTLYYNGYGGSWTLGGGRAVANAIAVLVSNDPPPPTVPPEGGIEICDGSGYGTPCTVLPAGRYSNLNDIGWYDRIESLRFLGGYIGNYHVVLSTETGHGGTPGHFERDEPNIPDPWRNRTRSIEIYYIDRNNPPSIPSLASPSDGYESTDGTAPNLCWNNSNDPEGDNPVQYLAEVYDSPVNANSGWGSNTCWRPGQLDSQFHTYKWRVRARDNKNKESEWSSTRTFTIRSNVPPATPTNFRVTGTTANTVTIAWDNVARESGYKIYKWGYDDTIDDWTFIYHDAVSADVTTYTDSNLLCAGDYWYEVSAYNEYGESAHHPWVKGTTESCPPVANDAIESATVIGSNTYGTQQDSTIATTAGTDPVLPCGSQSTGSASVWFRFTPTSTGVLDVNTNGSSYDTMLAVWRGSVGNLTHIACDDDGGEGVDSLLNRVYLYKDVTYYLEVVRYTPGLAEAEKPAEVRGDLRLPHPLPQGATAEGNAEKLQPEAGGGTLTLALTFTPTAPHLHKPLDFDADSRNDLAVYRPSNGAWFVLKSGSNYKNALAFTWGGSTDKPVPGDYDGDGKLDLAVYRPSNRTWFILKSSGNFKNAWAYSWGNNGDVPVPGDYDGDGRTDLAVFRPSTRVWYILKSSSNYKTAWAYGWGNNGDVPVVTDFDGDSRADLAVYRPSNGTWYILKSSTNYKNVLAYSWGRNGDVPVPGDYDGDGKTDLAVYRPSNSTWFISKSSSEYRTSLAYGWGGSSDKRVPGDYDGDGRTDIAVYRPSNGTWFILKSSGNFKNAWAYGWGSSTDIPIPHQ